MPELNGPAIVLNNFTAEYEPPAGLEWDPMFCNSYMLDATTLYFETTVQLPNNWRSLTNWQQLYNDLKTLMEPFGTLQLVDWAIEDPPDPCWVIMSIT